MFFFFVFIASVVHVDVLYCVISCDLEDSFVLLMKWFGIVFGIIVVLFGV